MKWLLAPFVALLIFGALIALTFLYMIWMPGRSFLGPLQPPSQEELQIRDNLFSHVWTLAGRIGERHVWNLENLEASAAYIQKALVDLGYQVAVQEYTVLGKAVRNMEVEIKGESAPDDIFILGAHYDSVEGSPGANDNASGVAALLEVARILAQQKTARTVRFVAFVNEEPPFFQSSDMGSRVYAARSRSRNEKIIGMFSLECVGFYSTAPGSQHYPIPFGYFYPRTGNFVGFVGNLRSRGLVHRSIASFRHQISFPSEGVAAPQWIPGIAWSDQGSFWLEGYPGIMVTDTAFYRYSHYHLSSDTPDRLDYASFARVVGGLARVVLDLAGRV